MGKTVLSHQVAQMLLDQGDPIGALCTGGPLLAANPSDLTAWLIVARATLALGDKKTSLKNMKSIASELAKHQNPIMAIALAKETAHLGENNTALIAKIAGFYAHGAPLTSEFEFKPPPIPTALPPKQWDNKLPKDALLKMAGETMAVAWGESQTKDSPAQLPAIPLLSALNVDDFQAFVGILKRETVKTGDIIVKQGEVGTAMYIVAQGEVTISHLQKSGNSKTLAQLGPGAFFGEMSLVSSASRAANAIANAPTVLLKADKREIEKLAREIPIIGDVLIAFCHQRMLNNLMRISPVFNPVPAHKRPDLIACFSTDYKGAEEIIIEQGKPGPGLYLIVSGKVLVTKQDDETTVQIATLGPGELFGEISLLMSKPSTATVTAIKNTALLTLSRSEFNQITGEFPELLKGVYDIAIEREHKNNSILGQTANDADDMVLV